MLSDCNRVCGKSEAYPKFRVRKDAMKALWGRLCGYLHNLVSVLALPSNVMLQMEEKIMVEILEYIEQRRVYYHVFHNGMKMNERKEVALFCYWVLKLMPFRCVGKTNSLVNRQVALCAFVNMLYAGAEHSKSKFCPTSAIIDNLNYSFRQHDLSQEALILLADALLRI